VSWRKRLRQVARQRDQHGAHLRRVQKPEDGLRARPVTVLVKTV
jgi:hypothetical protein